jgi:hypothetical protein
MSPVESARVRHAEESLRENKEGGGRVINNFTDIADYQVKAPISNMHAISPEHEEEPVSKRNKEQVVKRYQGGANPASHELSFSAGSKNA